MVLEQRKRTNASCSDFGRTLKGASMRILFKITGHLLREVKAQLARPHAFTSERVGFLLCRVGLLDDGGLIVLSHSVHDVADEDYIDDPTVGAMMGPAAIRKALQTAYQRQA